MRPFSIVEDRGFHALMKTGRPEYYLPSRSTVSRDVKEVYKKVRKRIGKMLQVLSVTCDNASPNDTMTDELAVLLEEFPGSANRTRCFTHILNLVAKGVLKQFDLPKKKAGKALDAAAALLAIEIQIEKEKLSMGDLSDEDEDDNEEGLTDIRDKMSEKDILDLDKWLQPVWLVLVKVRGLNFTLLFDDKGFLIASQTCIYYQKFHHTRSSGMVFNTAEAH